jgi:hypothetical protein
MPDGGLLRARSTIELEVVGDREDEDEPEERR